LALSKGKDKKEAEKPAKAEAHNLDFYDSVFLSPLKY
jgi:hypothetical protein